MRAIILTIVAIALIQVSFSTMIPHIGPKKPFNPPIFQLQLNDPPRQRWTNIVKHYLPQFQRLQLVLKEIFYYAPILKDLKIPVDLFADTYKYKEIVQELRGIADASQLPFETLFSLNFAYELSTVSGHACSGVIVRNINNTIIHGRNLDFEFWGTFAELVGRVQYYRGTTFVFQADQIVGSVFVLTGMKNGSFAISVDTRINGQYKAEFSAIFIKQYVPSAYLVRQVLEQADNFTQAVQILNTTNITAPIYYVVSGIAPNDGAIIERNIDGVHNYRQLNSTTWFLVQTNYDWGQKEPVWDQREAAPTERVQRIGYASFTIDDMFTQVMSLWPTFNIATLMTAIISSNSSFHNTSIWYNYTWY